ncbi:MAG: virulence RhuM family protein [Bacteroidales bacterium]|nr:virulence RhuM family protein [Bacteroidales bacterium]
MKNEIIIYQNEDSSVKIEVRIENDTVWLNIEQISKLFGRDRTVINRHINNIFKEGELKKEEVCAYFAHTTQHGALKGKVQTKNLEYYNLDVIISVGYRVKSQRGIQFRIWANKVLKEYLLKGYAVSQRFERIENDVHNIKKELGEIKLQLNTSLTPAYGIFYDGQIFDAYAFVSGIIKSAKQKIVLIDNYIDESVLLLLSKRDKDVKATVFTKNISKQLELDVKKHNQQYSEIEIKLFDKSHDRFLIIDNQIVYHIGASIKDLGKKWVAFSKMDIQSFEILQKL